MIANDRAAIPTPLSDLWNLTLDMTWLPDGTAMIAAVRDFRGVSENRLWRIPLVGNADNDATLFLDNPAYNHADYPRFSADGRYLAFRAAYVLTIIDTLGGASTQPDVNLPGNTPPVWTPAAFTGERDCG
jgi:Tol biopolymer transport system component